ncbi:MAG TPA: transglycosylase domain-containing protein [Candidatus Saccharimonadales bacterium]|nr:transglycosylase domain-containing protein [Candidatus Saccharimonadales bacterium]
MSANRSSGRNRARNSITTKSGKALPINRSLADRSKARKADRAAAHAQYLASLPKDRWKRIAYRLQPKRVIRYWFSREGGIMALKIIGVSIICGFFLTIGLFAYFRKDLPKIKDLSGDGLGGNTTYYDRTGKIVLWQDYNSVKRTPVETNEITPYMKEATVAVEDKDFYKHGAFDIRGIMRAGWHDLTGAGGSVQGGSTITQQLVKLNENWTNNRTITRKVKELILATELEREYSKDDILTGYLNTAPYGGVDYGVQVAAQDYFHTDAQHLTLAQATMLAAIPQSPSYYSPYGSHKYNSAVTQDTFNPGALVGRQQYILHLMVQQGYITSKQASDALKANVLAQVKPLEGSRYTHIKAPYFVLAAKEELEQTYGASTVNRGGWKVITTLDMGLQDKAQEVANANLPNINAAGADEEAMVGEDVKTGQIVTLIGGTDFNNPDYGQNNYAAGILIPPGSNFKPYDYTTLINNNNNVGAGSVLYDTTDPLPGYSGSCKFRPAEHIACPAGTEPYLYDYDFYNPGPVTLRYALGGSRNIPAVKAMLEAKPNDKSAGHVDSINSVIKTAGAMMDNTYDQEHHLSPYNCYADEKLTQPTQCYASSAIGDGAYLYLDDQVNGLATLARLGQAIPRTFILKISDSADKTVYQWTQPKAKQVVKADAAYIVDDMMADPNASYLSGSCTATNCYSYNGKFHRYNGWHFAIKTGTTNDGYDGLMSSWSTKYAMTVWVGNHTRRVTLHNFMENLTEPMVKPWMEYAHRDSKPQNWVEPKTVKSEPAYIQRSHIHYGDVEPGPTNDLFPSWYIGGHSNQKYTAQTIDRVSGKLATSCTPGAAKEVQSNGNVASWNIDLFHGGLPNIGSSGASNSTTTGSNPTDDVHNCNDSPPTVTLTAPNTCNTSCVITATVTQGTHPLTDTLYPQYPGKVVFTLGGKTIYGQHVKDSPSTVSFTYKPTASGSGTLTATVVDSVLYQGSASQTLSYSVPPPQNSGNNNLNLKVDSHNALNGTADLSWTSITGATYDLCWTGPTTGCDYGITGTSDTIGSPGSPLSPGHYTANLTAKDSGNNPIATDNKSWNQ